MLSYLFLVLCTALKSLQSRTKPQMYVCKLEEAIIELWRFRVKIRQSTIWYACSLGQWDKRLFDQVLTKDSSTKCLMFQVCIDLQDFMEKKTWNNRRMVHESFVLSAQRTSVVYCRLADFNSFCRVRCYELSSTIMNY